jgi:hypothetical protein
MRTWVGPVALPLVNNKYRKRSDLRKEEGQPACSCVGSSSIYFNTAIFSRIQAEMESALIRIVFILTALRAYGGSALKSPAQEPRCLRIALFPAVRPAGGRPAPLNNEVIVWQSIALEVREQLRRRTAQTHADGRVGSGREGR